MSAIMACRGAQLCAGCRADLRRELQAGSFGHPTPEPAPWLSRSDAITLVWHGQAARERTVGSRNTASYQLGKWRREGRIRTKPDPGARQPYQKHDPVLYRRSDVERLLGRLSAQAPKRPDGYDPELDRLIRTAANSRKRRRELGIATLGPPVVYAWM